MWAHLLQALRRARDSNPHGRRTRTVFETAALPFGQPSKRREEESNLRTHRMTLG